jgi:hypothetical protein
MGIALAICAPATVSAAMLLTPGGPAAVLPATLGSGPSGPSVVFYSSVPTADNDGNFTAQIDSAVTKGNTFGSSALTFWYRMMNVDQTPNGFPLVSLGVPLPGTASVYLDQVIGTGNLSGLGMNTGGAISFFWTTSPVLENQVSAWQAIETPFEFWVLKTVGAIDGTSEDVAALVPAVPEPSTYAGIFALGLAGFAAFRRFRA